MPLQEELQRREEKCDEDQPDEEQVAEENPKGALWRLSDYCDSDDTNDEELRVISDS